MNMEQDEAESNYDSLDLHTLKLFMLLSRYIERYKITTLAQQQYALAISI